MTTSNSFDYSLTAAGIMDMALENLGIVAEGVSGSSAQYTTMLRRLNVVAKQFQGTSDGSPGMKVHTRQRISLVLAKGQQTYLIGPASTDSRSSTLLGITTISANEAAAQTVISITSNTDTTNYPGTTITMAAADIVGIQLNDGTIHWTTISGTPAATMTITVQLPSASDAGKYVYWFTSRAQRFTVLESAVLRDSSQNDVPLLVYDEVSEYERDVPNKYADNDPTAILCEPYRLNTKITLNAQPADVTKLIILTALYPAEDYDASSDDIAFPQEWLRPLAWQLSFEAHSVFGRAWTESMEKNRTEALQIARNLNPEKSVSYYQPDA